MIPWRKSSKKDEEREREREREPEPEPMSISQFESKANDFLNDVEDKTLPSMFNRRADTFGDMLKWAIHAREKRVEMRNHINMQRSRLHQADEHINKIDHIRSNMEMEINSLHSMRERLAREKQEIENQHTRQLTEIAEQQSLDISLAQSKHEEEFTALKKKHQEEKNELLRQLLVSGRDDQGWPDDKMRLKFRELQRLMESVTAPRNREFLIPAGRTLPSHLDKTGFLGRAGNGKSHFLLKSTLWSIIGEQYFSAPFGFGIFGPRQSQKQLFGMYAAWRKLFDSSSVTTSPEREDYAIFKQDVSANNWRSATFQYINTALTSTDQSNSPVAQLNTENFNKTVARITTLLSEVASLSHATVRSEIEDQVRQMVSLGREIALQFGIQSSQLQLVVPEHGETIRIGERYHDCEDGDSGARKTCDVDIVTAPGLQKVGDGRSDMEVQRAMVPCEIYPIEDDEA